MHELHRHLPFLPERIKFGIVEKLVNKFENKEKLEKLENKEYVIHKRNLKQAVNHELVLKKVHRFIKLNQGTWLKPYNDMNTELRKNATNDFEKRFLQVKE